jgi:xanthine dehydrogenase accessory factor
MVGSVSAGCVEAAVVESALSLMSESDSIQLEFGVSDEMAWEVGLACGGEIRIHLERLDDETAGFLERRAAAVKRRENSLGLTWIDDRRHEFYEMKEVSSLPPGLREHAAQVFEGDHATIVDFDGASIFVHPFLSAPRMIIVGAVHIAQFLADFAGTAGFEVTVLDPRPAFATKDRFPNIALLHEWPDEAIRRLAPDSRTAIVTLSHDPKFDDSALERALDSSAFYIGSLGSRRTHAKRAERLRQLSVSEEQVARIHAPVGLDIGARSPSEIAISILAEVIQVQRSSF